MLLRWGLWLVVASAAGARAALSTFPFTFAIDFKGQAVGPLRVRGGETWLEVVARFC